MSQAAAGIDNRVPTPGSVAELSSQQALPDMSGTEVKSEVKNEDEDSNSGKKQSDLKMEVCLSFIHSVFVRRLDEKGFPV